MDTQQTQLRQEIVDKLSQYSDIWAFWLIVETILAWESILFQMGRITSSRYVPEAFKRQLDQLSTEDVKIQANDGPALLNREEAKAQAHLWGSKLAELQLEDTISVFALAVNDWLCTCGLASFRESGMSDYDAMSKCYWFLMKEIGAD